MFKQATPEEQAASERSETATSLGLVECRS